MFFPLAGTGQTWRGPIAGSHVAKYTRIRSRTFDFGGGLEIQPSRCSKRVSCGNTDAVAKTSEISFAGLV